MNKIHPLSKRELNNNITFNANKINKHHRNKISSITRRIDYNNPKLFMTLNNNFRNKFKEKPKLFSLLDINYKITNSRGTSLPAQYRRLTDSENLRLFGFSYRKDKKYNNNNQHKLNNKSEENIILSENEKNMENNRKINKCQSDFGDKFRLEKNNYFNKKFKSENVKINDIYNNKIKNNEIEIVNSNKENDFFNLKKNPIKLTKTKKSQGEISKLNNKEDEKIKENSKKDRFLPRGYDSYELLLKNPKILSKKIKIEYSMKKTLSAKIIKDRAYKSDIFFFKPPSEKEVSYKVLDKQRDYQNSDIFNIKNDRQNLSKSGETYLFKNLDKTKYNVTRESNSQWKLPDNKIQALINSSSKDYNILNPESKGISLSKEKIIIECESKKDKNSKMIDKANYMNPAYKKKGLTEFIDITRNGASNTGKDYINAYINNPKCFFKNNDVCSTFYDTHFQYKNLCKKPFIKNFFD